MRLLLFNLVTDADDPVLGFTTRWVHALAARVDLVHVLTMSAGRLEVPSNVRVHSVGKEKGYSEPRRMVEFYRRLLGILGNDRIDVCFSHMIPVFTVLAAPWLKSRKIPIVQWHAHPSLTWTLRLAHFASDRVVTSLRSAYPYREDKLEVIGQGIDTDLFHPINGPPENPSTILCVGRLSAVKNLEVLIDAVAQLRARGHDDLSVAFLGAAVTEDDRRYHRSLQQRAASLGLAGQILFERPVPHSTLPAWYRRCLLHVNLTPAGFGDKVAWEAMACGRPSVVANEEFRETLGRHADELLVRHADAGNLARKVEGLLKTPESARSEMGRYLRGRVVARHSLQRLAETLVDLFRRLAERG